MVVAWIARCSPPFGNRPVVVYAFSAGLNFALACVLAFVVQAHDPSVDPDSVREEINPDGC